MVLRVMALVGNSGYGVASGAGGSIALWSYCWKHSWRQAGTTVGGTAGVTTGVAAGSTCRVAVGCRSGSIGSSMGRGITPKWTQRVAMELAQSLQ